MSHEMKYQRFGKTELSIPIFSCGGMRYQQAWGAAIPEELDQKGQENLENTIYKALEVGINHIETARGYGTSEYQLGLVLPKIDRESYILQTKVSPKSNPKDFVEEFEKCMSLLKVDHLDLLGIHGINNQETLDWTLNGCFEEAMKLKKSGRVKHVGFSTHAGPDIISSAIKQLDFDYVNLHWYYIYQRNEVCIADAHEKDMGVFIISPNDKGGMLYQPSEKLVELTQPYSPMVFNDIFCLSNDNVHTLSLGASKPSDFDEHLKVPPIYQDNQHRQKVAEIAKNLDREKINVLGEDFATRWNESLPEWEQVPGEVNLYKVIWLWTLYKSFDMLDYAKMRYNLLGSGGHWFPGQKPKLEQIPEIVASLDAYPFQNEVEDILREAIDKFEEGDKKRLSESD